MTNRILAELKRDCWAGVPGAGDPYEWAMRGWMLSADTKFKDGIYFPFEPTEDERIHAAKVILRLGRIKGVREPEVVGTPKEIINSAFGLEIVK